MNRGRLLCGALALMLCSAAGCSWILGPRPDPSQFFVLTPDNAGAPGTSSSNLALGLGPIKFPDYLNRPEVVTRVANNRLDLSENRRWAEPLKKNFERVLAENLSNLLGTGEIRNFPWYRPAKIDYHLTIDVYRFESDDSHTAHLKATWEIKAPDTDTVLYSGRSDISEPAAQGEAGAEALSRAEAKFSREIADAVNSVRIAHPPSHAPASDSNKPA